MIEPRKQVNNIYGYIRVSSEQQVKDGSSLDEQKKSIEEFVANKYGGRKVDHFFTDAGISGMKPLLERPGSRELTDTMDANDVIPVSSSVGIMFIISSGDLAILSSLVATITSLASIVSVSSLEPGRSNKGFIPLIPASVKN